MTFDYASLIAPLLVFLLASLPLLVVLPSAPPMDDALNDLKENHMGLLDKAFNNQNLNPLERAALKFVETLISLISLAVLPVFAQALSGSGAIDWRGAAHLALFSAGGAILMAAIKWAKAHGDDPLVAAVEPILEAGAQRLTAVNGLNTPVIEPDVTPDPEPPTDTPASAALADAA